MSTPASGPLGHPSGDARRAALHSMVASHHDLLVVGGGITGAGVARDAALRGMKVALVEQGDFGCGTSSRSSKIIHGGVRYLEYLQFGLVRESARERRILRRIAPHLVHPLPFHYPVFRGESITKIRVGLKLFDRLAQSPPGERSTHLSPSETRQHLPGLREPLKGSVRYPEFITDDARFTLANVASAAAHGAHVANHVRVTELLTRGNRVVGARVKDLEGGGEFEIFAEVTVNAGGPWAEAILTASKLPVPVRMIRSKGIHILLTRSRLPLRAASFLRSSWGRRGLAMPRGRWVYVGTSDTEYTGDLGEVKAGGEEIRELLEMTADCFPDAALTLDDVKGSWAGVRPLVFEAGKTTRQMSRHDRVWVSSPGLVTVAGGKLTTYRPMARRILQAVAEALGNSLPGRERTDEVLLPGAPAGDLESFRAKIGHDFSRAAIPEAVLERITFLYGTEAEVLLRYGSENADWLEPLAPGFPALSGEVRLAIEEGMARTLEDVMDRRLALLLFGPAKGGKEVERAAEIASKLLEWTPERRRREIDSYRALVRQHRRPAPVAGSGAMAE